MAILENTLSKEERLFWKRSIDLLFAQGKSFMAYPLRVVYLPVEESAAPAAVMISVPKKRIKRAVHRNRIKRLVRETYRVRKHSLVKLLSDKNQSLYIAFLYVGNEVASFPLMESAMDKAIGILNEKIR
ncbi:ribonuclease P protein component [Parabacteroides sp. Marseille-P3160]|uniref:ribonuclease P protein component n=1 Tax=Parabacteroides sp. Marseille-P3160 TaxID=1917887 RepID=UPI0009BAAFFD|nr:ribonuclease P protein component [Parabacteroides sp. Marseille-P3160]